MEVSNTPDGKVPTATGQNTAGAGVARSGDSAKRQDLNFITKNNQIDAEYQLPIAADAQGTWVSQHMRARAGPSAGSSACSARGASSAAKNIALQLA